jgi:hypothetical protein
MIITNVISHTMYACHPSMYTYKKTPMMTPKCMLHGALIDNLAFGISSLPPLKMVMLLFT